MDTGASELEGGSTPAGTLPRFESLSPEGFMGVEVAALTKKNVLPPSYIAVITDHAMFEDQGMERRAVHESTSALWKREAATVNQAKSEQKRPVPAARTSTPSKRGGKVPYRYRKTREGLVRMRSIEEQPPP